MGTTRRTNSPITRSTTGEGKGKDDGNNEREVLMEGKTTEIQHVPGERKDEDDEDEDSEREGLIGGRTMEPESKSRAIKSPDLSSERVSPQIGTGNRSSPAIRSFEGAVC